MAKRYDNEGMLKHYKQFGEELILLIRLYYINLDGLANWDKYLNPYGRENVKELEEILRTDKVPFDENITGIIDLMNKNQFVEAANYALNLSGSNRGSIAYIFFIAILKIAREQISSSWLDTYLRFILDETVHHRSDCKLEFAKTQAILNAKEGRKADLYPIQYYEAALAGRHEAMDVMAKLCKNNFCSHREWEDEWRKRIEQSPDNLPNIFKIVEEAWIRTGNIIPVPLEELIEKKKKEQPLFPYYGFEEINGSNHWYILLQFSKLFPISGNEIVGNGFFKGTGLYKNSEYLDSKLRGFYNIPSDEIIFIIQDVTVLSERFAKGVVFTNKALYVKNSKLMRISWKDFCEKDYSIGMLSYSVRGQKFDKSNPEGIIESLLELLKENVNKKEVDCNYYVSKNDNKKDLNRCYDDSEFLIKENYFRESL